MHVYNKLNFIQVITFHKLISISILVNTHVQNKRPHHPDCDLKTAISDWYNDGDVTGMKNISELLENQFYFLKQHILKLVVSTVNEFNQLYHACWRCILLLSDWSQVVQPSSFSS